MFSMSSVPGVPAAAKEVAAPAVSVPETQHVPEVTISPPPSRELPVSIIGRDLKILGGGLLLISEGNLTIDGVVEGDVLGANVVIGQHGEVHGLVHGEKVSVLGQVTGTVRGVDVHLKDGSRVDAEVHNNSLCLELGACFEGRSRHYADPAQLIPDLAKAVQEERPAQSNAASAAAP